MFFQRKVLTKSPPWIGGRVGQISFLDRVHLPKFLMSHKLIPQMPCCIIAMTPPRLTLIWKTISNSVGQFIEKASSCVCSGKCTKNCPCVVTDNYCGPDCSCSCRSCRFTTSGSVPRYPVDFFFLTLIRLRMCWRLSIEQLSMLQIVFSLCAALQVPVLPKRSTSTCVRSSDDSTICYT